MIFESNMMRRQDFVKGALALAAGVGTLHASQRRNIRWANDDIRLGIIGIGRKGPQHIEVFSKLRGVRIVALCDCDTQHLDPAVAALKKGGRHMPGGRKSSGSSIIGGTAGGALKASTVQSDGPCARMFSTFRLPKLPCTTASIRTQ